MYIKRIEEYKDSKLCQKESWDLRSIKDFRETFLTQPFHFKEEEPDL